MSGARRATTAVLGASVAAAVLTSCASETESYCGTLTDKKQALADLAAASGEPGNTAFEDTLGVLEDLQADAPGDIEDEWSTLVFAYEALADALQDAGVEAGEYDPAAPPDGVSEEQVAAIEGAAAELASGRVLAAADGIEQHARDVCKVDLGLGSGGG